ncbi:MAG TPA: hypothetical protein ENN66_00750 [Proteobacteria bacterium]|nr:hypothetical protein [Pseudomonadota bacterium]
MTAARHRNYRRDYAFSQTQEAAGFIEIIQKIPTLTKIGAIFLVMGKFIGVLAIPAAFIPSLNVLVIPLIVTWGSFVFLSIALCSVDHFRRKKLQSNADKMELISAMIDETPELRERLQAELEHNQDGSAVIIPLAVGH